MVSFRCGLNLLSIICRRISSVIFICCHVLLPLHTLFTYSNRGIFPRSSPASDPVPAVPSPLSVGQHSTLPPDTFLTATKTFVLFSATEAGDEKTLDSQAKQARPAGRAGQHCKNAKTKGWKKSICTSVRCVRRITPQLVANVMTGSVTSGPGTN